MDDFDLDNISAADLIELLAAEEQEKVASDEIFTVDDFADAGYRFGAGIAAALDKQASDDGVYSAADILSGLTEEDLAQIPADEFLELAELAEQEKTASGEPDLAQISALELLEALADDEPEKVAGGDIDLDDFTAGELLEVLAELEDDEPSPQEKIAAALGLETRKDLSRRTSSIGQGEMVDRKGALKLLLSSFIDPQVSR